MTMLGACGMGKEASKRTGSPKLLIPAVAALAVLASPTRGVVVGAILVTATLMLLGSMTVGMFFAISLAALILALGEFRRRSSDEGMTGESSV